MNDIPANRSQYDQDPPDDARGSDNSAPPQAPGPNGSGPESAQTPDFQPPSYPPDSASYSSPYQPTSNGDFQHAPYGSTTQTLVPPPPPQRPGAQRMWGHTRPRLPRERAMLGRSSLA